MVEFGFGRRFHDHNYFEVEMFFYIPWIYYLLEGIIWNFAENHQLNVILSHLKQIPDNHLLIQHHLLAQHLHRRLQHVDFPWAFFYVIIHCLVLQINMFLKCLWFLSSQFSKLVYSFESLSLNTWQRSGYVHYIVLAPNHMCKTSQTQEDSMY